MRPASLLLVALAVGPCWSQPERHVVIIDLDGVRRDLLETTYLGGRMPQLERLFGSPAGAGFAAALYFERATAVAPTVTMSGQASLFTGAYPAVHGIAGNAWFDRDQAVDVDYMSTAGSACVYGISLFGTNGCQGGRANHDLTSPTLYDWATAAGLNSVVVFNQFWKGATRVIEPSLFDALALLQSGGFNLEFVDRNMTSQAIAEIQQHGLPAILTLYFTGADSAGHGAGTTALTDYLNQVIDPLLGTLFDALEQSDPAWLSNTLFVVSADHGRTEASAIPEDLLALGWMADTLSAAGFDADHVRIANQGGLAYIYLRPADAPWSEMPSPMELAAAAVVLAEDGRLTGELDSVCYRDAGYHCLNPLAGESARLLDALMSARTGDLIAVAKTGRYFGNPNPGGAEHGALNDSDLDVPLILAGGGILPARVPAPVSNVQIAATVAAYLGFQAPGALPGLPNVFLGKGRRRIPPPHIATLSAGPPHAHQAWTK